MSVSYFVRYEGPAENWDAFFCNYRDRHVPIIARFPGVRQIVLHTPIPGHDPFPVQSDRFMLLVQMVFDTPEDLEAALKSEARADARQHFATFPPFQGGAFHQAVSSQEVYRIESPGRSSGGR
jgi:uncharacterized protein (TIGR02118 family)